MYQIYYLFLQYPGYKANKTLTKARLKNQCSIIQTIVRVNLLPNPNSQNNNLIPLQIFRSRIPLLQTFNPNLLTSQTESNFYN